MSDDTSSKLWSFFDSIKDEKTMIEKELLIVNNQEAQAALKYSVSTFPVNMSWHEFQHVPKMRLKGLEI